MKPKVKVLIFIDWFLPDASSGGPVRSIANLIDHLNEGFEFYIITRNTDYQKAKPLAGIRPNVWIDFNSHTKVFYASKDRRSARSLKQIISSVEFDVALINGMYSWQFSIMPLLLLKKLSKPVIVSARGMLNPQAFSVGGFKKKFFLFTSKLFHLYKNVRFHATNADERANIIKFMGNDFRIYIAPNLPRKMSKINPKETLNNPKKFVCIARIAPEKGTLILLKALQKVDEALVLDIYGSVYNESYWNQCKEVIDTLPEKITVNYKGVAKSEEVLDLLKNYDYFAMLSEGENFGHSIFEAFSVGLPVLISNQTPWKELEMKRMGWDVDITHKEEIVDSIKKAISLSLEEYKIWSEKCLRFVSDFSQDLQLLNQNKDLFLHAR